MIELSVKLTEYVNNLLGTTFKSFNEDILCDVIKLEISKEDIPYLKYFNNLKSVEFNSFPSINQSDLDEVAALVPKLTELTIKEQSALLTINLETFFYLEKLTIISNDNLTNIFNLDKMIRLKELTIYNNKKLNIEDLYEYISEMNVELKIDLIYYFGLTNYLIKNEMEISDQLFEQVKFVDCYGFRNVHIKTLKKDALFSLVNNISDIVSLYCFKEDTDIKKFCVLHKWMLDNIVYINEDVEEHLEYYGVVDAFIHKKAGRLSYARVFQLLLIFAGIETSLVYSSGVTNLIGKYQDIELLTFDGNGDYAMVRSLIDGKYYYTDIAWNKRTLEENCYNDLKILLVSKDDLMLKHSLVGEGIVEKTATYNYKVIEEINDQVENNIQDVDYMFKEVEISDDNVLASSQMFADNNNEIEDLKRKISQEEVGTELYNNLVEELIALEKVINSYNKILVKYNDGQKAIINKYSNFILNNYFGVVDNNRIDGKLIKELELRYDYHVISKYLYDLLKMYLNVNNIK